MKEKYNYKILHKINKIMFFRKYIKCTCCLLFVISLNVSCDKKKSKHIISEIKIETKVVELASRKLNIGDSILIKSVQSIKDISITLDNRDVKFKKIINDILIINPQVEKTGLHKLVINGLKTGGLSFSDTLEIEFWSNIKPKELKYTVLKTYPHQSNSFTEGLELYNGYLYESTGLNGFSKLMKIELFTGSVLKYVPLPNQYFGEGITIVNDKIYQLTWTSGLCFRYTNDLVLEKIYLSYTGMGANTQRYNTHFK